MNERGTEKYKPGYTKNENARGKGVVRGSRMVRREWEGGKWWLGRIIR